ncbi:MAG TPA: hypothetical protein VJW73_15530 [Gemmatimonadaceae bacterium]|nr:hypothetical protein [Gemmatimonadaceae bacterium]
MTSLPPPRVPWQITGNHWIALPCIHPVDGSLHALGVLHRGSRSAIELAGSADFLQGSGAPLLKPTIGIGGATRDLAGAQMAWERALGWIPTFSCTIADVVVRGSIFAPYGRDADVAGAVYALSVENRTGVPAEITIGLEGRFAHRQLRVRSSRRFVDSNVVSHGAEDVLLLEGSAPPGDVAVGIGGDGAAQLSIADNATNDFALKRVVRVAAGEREHVAFYIAAGPERDGAEATVRVLRRRGWRELLTSTRDALQSLQQTATNDAMDRVINRNLLFAYFYSVGRALDDAHYYVVRSRAPWNGRGITVRDWEALVWTIPAVQLADAPLARELLLRVCELHGYAPGRGVHYMDGTLFEPGFTLEGAAAYALATDRYIRDTGDDQIVEEPALADTLYLAADDLATRRDRRVPLYHTEVSPSGTPPAHPFALHGNAVVAQALEVLRRTLDEETAREVEDPEAVRAAIRRHFVVEREGKDTYAAAVDLAGGISTEDDPLGSALWLPLYDAVARHDSTYRRTVKSIGAEPRLLAQQCARLIGPEAGLVLQWLRRAPLDGGIAAEEVDADGRARANGGDAALSGLLAWSVWYAVNALGERP